MVLACKLAKAFFFAKGFFPLALDVVAAFSFPAEILCACRFFAHSGQADESITLVFLVSFNFSGEVRVRL